RCGLVDDGCQGTQDCGACGQSGAWGICFADTDCADGRSCSKALQETVAPGRPGGCIEQCPSFLDSSGCDPVPAGSTATLGCSPSSPSYCVMRCTTGTVCPPDHDCVSSYCVRKVQ